MVETEQVDADSHDACLRAIGSGKIEYYKNKVLGEGIRTTVYEGRYEGTLPVAVKVVPENKIESIREAEFLRELNHSNIIWYYHKEESETCVYLVLELCDGCLVDLVEKYKNHFSIDEISNPLQISLAHDIIKGLAYLHKNDIYHGDLKPQNILIWKSKDDDIDANYQFSAVISDFGISLKFDPNRSEKTVHEQIIGTEGWLAKEVLDSQKSNETFRVTKAADILRKQNFKKTKF